MSTRVKAVRKQATDSLREPGAYVFINYNDQGAPRSMVYACPCGCGRSGVLDFDNDDRPPTKRLRWHWNGSWDKPTLDRAVWRTQGCKWHGRLLRGWWVFDAWQRREAAESALEET